jgi:hypothetical protein
MTLRLRWDWRRIVVYTHRWLGIAGCLFFVAWFVSGIVMMYARMPRLSADERLARLAPLDLSAARVSPVETSRAVRGSPRQVRVAMLDGRPVYRFGSTTVFADNAEPLDELGRERALHIALSLGGIVSSTTMVAPAWRRLRRHARRLMRRA